MNLAVRQFGIEQTLPSHRYGPHVRDHYLIHYVFHGKGTLYAEGRMHAIGEGQAFVIFPGQITLYQADREDPWHYGWVGFDGEEAEPLVCRLGAAPERPVLDCRHNLLPVIRQMQQDVDLGVGPLALAGGLLRFLALLGGPGSKANSSSLALYEKALWYFRGNYPRPITIAETARFVGLSRSQLFRIFAAACGQSPKRVLTGIRLEEACRLLRETGMSVQEITYAIGISSASRFCAMFLEQFGVTPGQYAKANRKANPK